MDRMFLAVGRSACGSGSRAWLDEPRRFRAKAGTAEAQRFIASSMIGYTIGFALVAVGLFLFWQLIVGLVVVGAVAKTDQTEE